MGKPLVNYSRALAKRICDQLARGRTLKAICRDDGMPARQTVQEWVRTDRDGFAARYRALPQRCKPTRYSRALAERICAELASGRTLKDVCSDDGLPPYRRVWTWAKEDFRGFATPYRQAREIGYHIMVDDMLEIADDSRNDFVARRRADGRTEMVVDHDHIARVRIRLDTRRWLLSRALPRLSGDRPDPIAAPDAGDSVLRLMKEIDGQTRGLPRDDPPPRV